MKTDLQRQQAYDRALREQRAALLRLEADTVDRLKLMTLNLSGDLEGMIRYTYDAERAARNLAGILQELQAKAGATLDAAWPAFEQSIGPALQQAGLDAGATLDRLLAELGEKRPRGQQDFNPLKIVTDFSAELVKNVKPDILRAINTTIRAGVAGGASPSQLILDLAKVIPTTGTRFERMVGGPLVRAEAIMRTELARVDSLAQQLRAEQYGKVGVSVIKIWLHFGKGRAANYNPRPGHLAMNGQKRAILEPFLNPLTLATLMHPHDPLAPASETVNCGCAEQITTEKFAGLFPTHYEILKEAA